MSAVKGWQTKRFHELGMILSGSTPPTTVSSYWDGEIVWITPNDLSKLHTPYLMDSAKKITAKGLKSCSARLLPSRSIVISSRAPIGYSAISSVEFCTNQGCKSIKLKDDFDPEFTYYNILFNIDKVKNLGEGTTFAEISKATLSNVQVDFPTSKPEQTKIAEVLLTVDRSIEQTGALIAKQQRVKTGLMQDLLTRGIDEHDNLRSEETHEFKDSPLGRIPMEWEDKSIEKLLAERIITDVQDGNHGEIHPKSRDFVNEGIPFIMASDISEGFVNVANAKKITEQQYLRLRIGFSKPRDVLLSHKASIGFVAEVPDSVERLMLTPQVTYYRIGDTNSLVPSYFAQFLHSENFQKPLKGLAKQSTRDYVGILAQRKLRIAFPRDTREQARITSLLAVQEDKIVELRRLLRKLHSLKTALMQDFLTGEKRVTPLLDADDEQAGSAP